ERTVEYASFGLLYIAAVLTFWSMFQYLNAARKDLLEP
ncbi:MAG: CDP-diacylglycerol--glycerol-3-phosphate 3-phosphatidyltransferase, partial [Serratia inhibens]